MKKFLTLIAFFAINSLASAQVLKDAKDAHLDAGFLNHNHSIVPHNDVRASAVAAEANQIFNDIKLDMKSGDAWQSGPTRFFWIARYLQGQNWEMGPSTNYNWTYEPHSRTLFFMSCMRSWATINTPGDAVRKHGAMSYVSIDANIGDTLSWKTYSLYDVTEFGGNATTTNLHEWFYPTVVATNPSKSSNPKDVYVSFVTRHTLEVPPGGSNNTSDWYRWFGFTSVQDLENGLPAQDVTTLKITHYNDDPNLELDYGILKGVGASFDGKPYAFYYGWASDMNRAPNMPAYTQSYAFAAANIANASLEKDQILPPSIMKGTNSNLNPLFSNTIMASNNNYASQYSLDYDDNGNLYFAFNAALHRNTLDDEIAPLAKFIRVPAVVKTRYNNQDRLDFNDMVVDTIPNSVVIQYIESQGGVANIMDDNYIWNFYFNWWADGAWDLAFNVIAENEYSFFLPLQFNDGANWFLHLVEVSSKNKNWTIRKISELKTTLEPTDILRYEASSHASRIVPLPVMYSHGRNMSEYQIFPNDRVLSRVAHHEMQLARTADNEYYVAKWIECNTKDRVPLSQTISFKSRWTNTPPQQPQYEHIVVETSEIYKSRILMSYRHKNSNVWSPPVEPFTTNKNAISMVHTFMPKIVPSTTEVPFTFFRALNRVDSLGNPTENGEVQHALRAIHPMLANTFVEYAYNFLVIGDAVNGFVWNGVEDVFNNIIEGDAADAYSLSNAYPNPTSNEIIFKFSLMQPAHTTLVITNALGQTVATVVDQFCNAVVHTVRFDTGKLPIGTYYYTLTSGSRIETKMFTVVR